MKSLAERHEDRAQRKADNMAESGYGDTANKPDFGHIANLVMEATAAMGGLSAEDRAKFEELHGDSLKEHAASVRSLAEGEDGNLSLAGIGTINADVVPLEVALNAGGTPALSGKLPEPSFDPANGNLNGQAVDAAGSTAEAMRGWGDQAGNGGGGAPGDGYGGLSVNELKTKLDAAGVSYTSSVNKDGLIDMLRNHDKTNAG